MSPLAATNFNEDCSITTARAKGNQAVSSFCRFAPVMSFLVAKFSVEGSIGWSRDLVKHYSGLPLDHDLNSIRVSRRPWMTGQYPPSKEILFEVIYTLPIVNCQNPSFL